MARAATLQPDPRESSELLEDRSQRPVGSAENVGVRHGLRISATHKCCQPSPPPWIAFETAHLLVIIRRFPSRKCGQFRRLVRVQKYERTILILAAVAVTA